MVATFIMSKIICIPFIKRPFQRLDDPNYYGIKNAVNIRIPVEPGQELGAWFIRPHDNSFEYSAERRWNEVSNYLKYKDGFSKNIASSSLEICDKSDQLSKCQKDNANSTRKPGVYLTNANETMILYLHGNSETRSQFHRRELCKKIQALGIPILAIDYRGYGDSYGGFGWQTTQSSMVWDGVVAIRFLKQYIDPSTKIIVWGHSLGTGVTLKLGR